MADGLKRYVVDGRYAVCMDGIRTVGKANHGGSGFKRFTLDVTYKGQQTLFTYEDEAERDAMWEEIAAQLRMRARKDHAHG